MNVSFKFRQRRAFPHWKTVAHDMKVGLGKVDDFLAHAILYISVPNVPLTGDRPSRRPRSRWELHAPPAGIRPDFAQRLPDAVAGNTPTDREYSGGSPAKISLPASGARSCSQSSPRQSMPGRLTGMGLKFWSMREGFFLWPSNRVAHAGRPTLTNIGASLGHDIDWSALVCMTISNRSQPRAQSTEYQSRSQQISTNIGELQRQPIPVPPLTKGQFLRVLSSVIAPIEGFLSPLPAPPSEQGTPVRTHHRAAGSAPSRDQAISWEAKPRNGGLCAPSH